MAELTGGIASVLRDQDQGSRIGGNLLLGLEPRAFLSALDELGLPADQREFLLRQYRVENSPLSRLYRGIQAVREGEDGRVRSSILPMTRPEGMTGYEALKEGEAEFAVPEFLLGGAESLLNVLDMPGATLRGPVSESEVGEVALETAGALALPSVGALPDPNVARMFGGRGTMNQYANKAMDRAEELRDQGLGPEDIWRKTAEEFPDAPASVLPDGRPFYEMPDAEAFTQRLGLERKQELIAQRLAATDPDERAALKAEINRIQENLPASGIISTPLSDVLSHPQLYQDFPEVGEIGTSFKRSLPAGTAGQYYPPGSASSPRGAIHVGTMYANQPLKEAGVLLHETQHGIAGIKPGTIPQGQNPATIREYIKDADSMFSTYAEIGTEEAARLRDRIDDLESGIYDRAGPEGVRLFAEITDPLLSEISMVREAATAPAKTLSEVLYGPEGVTKGFGTQDAAWSLYRMDPGEALARLTASRREMSMAERRETTPMQTLRQESRPLEWEELTKLQSQYDLRDLLRERFAADLERPTVEGIDYSNYLSAIDSTIDDLPPLVSEVLDRANMAATPEARREILVDGRNRVRRLLQGKLKGFQ